MPLKKLWEMKWTEVVEYAKKVNDVVIVPIGSIEQHGPHAPLGTDALNAIKVAEMVSERTGAVVAAPIWYGAHMYHQLGFPGTVPIRTDVLKEYVKDVIRGLANVGFNKIIILNAHGQQWALISALHDIVPEVKVFVAVATLWELARKTINEVCEEPFRHADECETSISLALYPELVDMSKAGKEHPPTFIDSKFLGGTTWLPDAGFPHHNISAFYFQKDTLKLGILGDATKASREKGLKIVEAAVNTLTEFINQLLQKFPPGKSPFK
ncbi:MAG: creatininase family protein [Desulfurococcaceae archaeon]